MAVKIDRLKCIGCGACTFVCPVEVLEIEDMKCKANPGCISCGQCVTACTWDAITLVEETPEKKG
jgi:ferredoxin